MYKIYGVQTNETISSIANKLGIDAEILGAINGLSIDTVLNPGVYIVVPNTDTYFNNYKVKKGDTVYDIARQNNIDPKQLLKLNGLNENDIIYVDQDIIIPGPNTNFYVTGSNDTLRSVTQKLGANIDDILNQNSDIYLMEDQLIVYKN